MLHKSACRTKGAGPTRPPYLGHLFKTALDVPALEPWPGFVQRLKYPNGQRSHERSSPRCSVVDRTARSTCFARLDRSGAEGLATVQIEGCRSPGHSSLSAADRTSLLCSISQSWARSVLWTRRHKPRAARLRRVPIMPTVTRSSASRPSSQVQFHVPWSVSSNSVRRRE